VFITFFYLFITKKFIMEEFSKKVNLRNLDRKLEEFKSKKKKVDQNN